VARDALGMKLYWHRPLTGATILLMDPELKTLLSALLDGQVKLTEGHAALVAAQQKTEARIDALAEGQAALVVAQQKTEARIDALAEGQAALVAAQQKTEARIDALAEAQIRTEARIDALAEAQIRTEARIDALAAATNELTADVGLLAKAVGRMDDRLERFTDSVLRGFTSSSEHRSALEERVGRLEQSVFGE